MRARRSRILRWSLFAAAALLGGGFVWTRAIVARIELDHPPGGAFVAVEGARVHFVEKGRGRPIVLLHGAYGGLEDWRASILDAVAARGRAIAIDRPGHGWSACAEDAPLVPDAQARWLHAVLAELQVERPVLVGFSWSGALALSYALQFERETAGVMVVNGANYAWTTPTSASDKILALPFVGPFFAHTLATPAADLFREEAVARAFRPGAVSVEYVHSALELALRPAALVRNAREVRALNAALPGLSARWPDVRVPLAIVAGLDDEVTFPHHHSTQLHDAVPGSTLALVAGAGHQIAFTHPSEVLRALDELLSRLAAPGSAGAPGVPEKAPPAQPAPGPLRNWADSR